MGVNEAMKVGAKISTGSQLVSITDKPSVCIKTVLEQISLWRIIYTILHCNIGRKEYCIMERKGQWTKEDRPVGHGLILQQNYDPELVNCLFSPFSSTTSCSAILLLPLPLLLLYISVWNLHCAMFSSLLGPVLWCKFNIPRISFRHLASSAILNNLYHEAGYQLAQLTLRFPSWLWAQIMWMRWSC